MRRPDRIHFTCRVCGFGVRAPHERAGKRAKCPTCGTKIEVPRSDEGAPPAPPIPPPVGGLKAPMPAAVAGRSRAGTPDEPLSLDDATAVPPPEPRRSRARPPEPSAPSEEGARRVEDTKLLPGCLAALGVPVGIGVSLLAFYVLSLIDTKLSLGLFNGLSVSAIRLIVFPMIALAMAGCGVGGWFLGRRVRRSLAVELEPGERLLARHRPMPFTGAATTLGGTVVLFVFGCAASDSSIKVMFKFTDTALPAWPFFTLAGLGALASGALIVPNLLTLLVVTDRRLVLKQPAGTRELPLADVRAVTLDTMRYGARPIDPEVKRFTTLTVETRHGCGEGLALAGMIVSEELAREIERRARRLHPRVPDSG